MSESNSGKTELATERNPDGQFSRLLARMEHHSGPLPHPDILAKYGQIDPSLPARIMQNAEKESDHRREMEKTVLSGEIRDNAAQIAAFARGQWLGFFLGFLVLVVAGYALFQHETIIGSIGLGTTLVLVIGAFYPKKHIDSSGQQDDAVPTAPSQNDKITLPKKERRRG